MMKSPKTRASKAVLKARAARDLAAIDGDQAVFRIEEAARRRMVAEAREQYEELIEVVDDEEFDRALSLRTPERKLRKICLLYTSPSPRDATLSRMPSSA